jgi:hypothetical protein
MKIFKRALLFVLVCTFFAGSVSAYDQTSYPSMHDITENWTNKPTAPNPPEEQYTTPPKPEPQVPVGDSLLTVVLLSGLYMLWNRKMKRAQRFETV